MTNGRPVTSDIASDERSTCPPPSPAEPSIVRMDSAIFSGLVIRLARILDYELGP